MAENLGLALAELFGQDILANAKLAELALTGNGDLPAELPATTSSAGTVDLALSSLEELIMEANTRYSQAQSALLAGNWADYGAELEALQQVLERMMEISGVSLEPTPQPTPLPTPTATPAADESSG